MRKIIAVFYLTVFFGCISCHSKKEKKTDLESNQEKGSYVDLNNKKVDFSSFKGKKVLLNYWATWCKPCIEEMPALLKAQKVLKAHNYVFLLVSDEDIAKISHFKNDKKYNFRFLKSTGSTDALGVYMLPTTFVFNEEGKKAESITGSVLWDSEEMINKLKAL
tara:strand:- start:52984 stop:53472 length:489 start_codon:yes stop_codon:yes gene_type:complete